jgi:hypothetical protein
MQLIDVLKGTGTVVSKSGSVLVQYNLEVYENEIRGWIKPHSGERCEMLTLQMQNGTSVRFSFTEVDCTVIAQDGIIRPIPAVTCLENRAVA